MNQMVEHLKETVISEMIDIRLHGLERKFVTGVFKHDLYKNSDSKEIVT